MTKRLRLLSIVLLIPFTALSALAIHDVGFVGVLTHQFVNTGGMQVFADLAIALLFIMMWMVPDAKKAGRNPWPYIAITLALGSFGPLLYFVFAPTEGSG